MKTKKIKSISAKILEKIAIKIGQMSVESACCYIYHQPKMPENLKKNKLKNEKDI